VVRRVVAALHTTPLPDILTIPTSMVLVAITLVCGASIPAADSKAPVAWVIHDLFSKLPS